MFATMVTSSGHTNNNLNHSTYMNIYMTPPTLFISSAVDDNNGHNRYVHCTQYLQHIIPKRNSRAQCSRSGVLGVKHRLMNFELLCIMCK